MHDTVFSIFYYSFPSLYAFGYEFRVYIFVGGIQIIGFSPVDKAAYHVIDGCKCSYFAHPVGDVYSAYIGKAGIKTLCFQQCTEQDCHSFAVAVPFTQHFCGSIGFVSQYTCFKSDITDILLYPGICVTYFFHVRTAAFGDFC